MISKVRLSENAEAEVAVAFSNCRAEILNAVEQEAGKSERWEFLRKRILTLLGDRGLYGQIQKIMNTAGNNEGGSRE